MAAALRLSAGLVGAAAEEIAKAWKISARQM